MPIVLLKGDIGSGKSILVKRILSEISPANTMGFYTKRRALDIPEVIITGLDEKEEMMIGRYRSGIGMEPCPEGFFYLGVKLLSGIKESTFLVIDELGYLEDSAPCFRHEVLKAISKAHSGIVVLRNANTPFLDAVSSSANTKLILLDIADREAKENIIINLLKQS